MSGLIGEDSGSSGSSQALASSSSASVSGPGPSESAERPAPRDGKVRIWFAALLRSAVVLVLTLIVLAVLGGVSDVVLHVTRHSSSSAATFSAIDAVDVVLDGDISLSVVGRTDGGTGATLAAVDTSTPFDDPIRTTAVIGGTLYLTERCPDSRCAAQLTLTLNTNDEVEVVSGNALRLDDAVVDIAGIDGQTIARVAPGKLIVTNTIVTGAVIGTVECDTDVDCRGVVTAPGTSRGSDTVEG